MLLLLQRTHKNLERNGHNKTLLDLYVQFFKSYVVMICIVMFSISSFVKRRVDNRTLSRSLNKISRLTWIYFADILVYTHIMRYFGSVCHWYIRTASISNVVIHYAHWFERIIPESFPPNKSFCKQNLHYSNAIGHVRATTKTFLECRWIMPRAFSFVNVGKGQKVAHRLDGKSPISLFARFSSLPGTLRRKRLNKEGRATVDEVRKPFVCRGVFGNFQAT